MIDALKNQLNGLPPGFRASAPLVVSVAAIGFSVIATVRAVGTLGEAAIEPSISEESADPLSKLAADSEAFLETSRKRFDGRSVYSLPPPPVRKPVIVERPKPVEPPPDPGPPPPPATYTGPAPTGVIGDIVMFGPIRVRVGETSDGIKVLSVNVPYSVEVEHMRGTYTVPLWTRFDERLLRPANTSGATRGIKSAETASGSAPSALGGAGTPGALGVPGALGAPGSAGSANASAGLAGSAGAAGATGAANGAQPPGRSPSTNQATREGGIVVPAGVQPPTPNGLPSPAMEPQEVPPPNDEPSDPNEEPSSSGPGIEYVDRAHLPPPRSEQQIAAMSIAQAREALAEIDETASWTVDGHSRARLNYERELLVRRINGNP